MSDLQIAVLALVQGITEFLPISSSAHLILVPVVTDWRDQGLAFDIAVHVELAWGAGAEAVARGVQERVAEYVARMANVDVPTVDVVVELPENRQL